MTASLAELGRRLRAREVSSLELLDESLARLATEEPRIAAFVRVSEDLARTQAAAAEERFAQGEPAGPLDGIPVGLKDVLSVRDVETTAGSRILRGYRPPFDATAVARLRAGGAVFVGMTNCDEFAMGSSTENSSFFPTRNPHDPRRVPGGSSGGSAAAVAAGEVAYALGTDTGGSIRQPAALCGVVGMKPTYGRVSRYGLIAFASSLDQIGPLTNSVDDAALVLEAISGVDPMDATSADRAVDYRGDATAGLQGLRLGLPRQYFDVQGLEPGVRAAVDRAVASLADAGAHLVEVDLPHTEYGLAAYYIVAPAECSSNLARFDGVRFGARHSQATLLETYLGTRRGGFGPEVRRRLMLGTYALSSGYYDAYYLKAQKVRTLVARDFETAFQSCDAIIGPTSPTVAFPIGEKTNDPYAMYLCDVFTLGANLAGLPGLSVPCGSVDGLPVGLQVLAPQWQDAMALRVAGGYEALRG